MRDDENLSPPWVAIGFAIILVVIGLVELIEGACK